MPLHKLLPLTERFYFYITKIEIQYFNCNNSINMPDFFLTIFENSPIIGINKQWIISLIVGCPIFTLDSYDTSVRDEKKRKLL